MPTEAKQETVAELTEEARGSAAMIVSEYRGLKVSELGEIRRNLRKQNVSYRVVKNRLMKIAATEAGAERLGLLLEGPTAVAFGSGDEAAMAKAVLDTLRPYRVVKNRLMKIAATDAGAERLGLLLEGPTAVAFGAGDEAAMAKAVLDTLRPYRVVKIRGALLGKSQVVDADGVTALAQLPTRETLLAQLAGAFSAPLTSIAGLLDAPLREVDGLLTALAEKGSSAA